MVGGWWVVWVEGARCRRCMHAIFIHAYACLLACGRVVGWVVGGGRLLRLAAKTGEGRESCAHRWPAGACMTMLAHGHEDVTPGEQHQHMCDT